MGIRTFRLRQLGHTNGHFRDARTALAHEAVSSEPAGCAAGLHILSESNIDSVMVLGYVAVEIIEPAVTNLHINLPVKKLIFNGECGAIAARLTPVLRIRISMPSFSEFPRISRNSNLDRKFNGHAPKIMFCHLSHKGSSLIFMN